MLSWLSIRVRIYSYPCRIPPQITDSPTPAYSHYHFYTYVSDFLDSSKAFSFQFSAHPSPLFAHCVDLSMP